MRNLPKLLILIFEENLDFHSHGQDEHGHEERSKYALRRVFRFNLCVYLGNIDEELLPMVGIERSRAEMAKHAPIANMSDEAD